MESGYLGRGHIARAHNSASRNSAPGAAGVGGADGPERRAHGCGKWRQNVCVPPTHHRPCDRPRWLVSAHVRARVKMIMPEPKLIMDRASYLRILSPSCPHL